MVHSHLSPPIGVGVGTVIRYIGPVAGLLRAVPSTALDESAAIQFKAECYRAGSPFVKKTSLCKKLCNFLWYTSGAMNRAKTVRVVMPEPLVASIDALSRQRCESRGALVREACAAYISSPSASAREAEAERRYIVSFTRYPETHEEEDWSEWYEAFLKETRETEEFWQELPCSG